MDTNSVTQAIALAAPPRVAAPAISRPAPVEASPAASVKTVELDPIPAELRAELVPPNAGLRNVRAEIGIDKAAGQFFARVFDKDTGEMIAEYPAEKALRAIAVARDLFRRMFDGMF